MLTNEVSKKYFTIAEYLQLEDASAVRHEFDNGTIVEMAGGILPHNVVKGEVYTLINNTLRGGGILPHNAVKLRLSGKIDLLLESENLPHVACNSDTKVRIEALNRFVYPDLTVSDGTPEYYQTPDGQTRRDIITNPLVIIEVLSENTREYDKGGKFDSYCRIPSFREYILIEPEEVWVKTLYLHDPENNLWKLETVTDPVSNLNIRSLGLTLPLASIYEVLKKLPA